jgi:hypothetical protein
MAAGVEVSIAEGYVWAQVRGELMPELADEAAERSMHQAKGERVLSALLDLKQAQLSQELASGYNCPNLPLLFGLRRTDRIALLCQPGTPLHPLMEEAAADAGPFLRVFIQEQKGIRWLRAREGRLGGFRRSGARL